MPSSDYILISNLALYVRIGVTDEEQLQPQRLSVSLTLHPVRSFAELHDCIERTINYAEVCEVIKKHAAIHPRRLIETLAEEIAAAVLANFAACAAVDVELRKFILPDTDYVAVHLSRQRLPHL